MPIAKRAKKQTKTHSKKKTPEHKEALVKRIHAGLKKYQTAIVFQYKNMSTNPFKDLQQEWKEDSKFFLGKNKVMQIALGRDEESSKVKQSYLLSNVFLNLIQYLKGERGLLLTNKTPKQLSDFLDNYMSEQFARGGHVAERTIVLKKGIDSLKQFAFSIESYLRKLGLNTQLMNQQIVLNEDYTVCQEGQPITVEQSKLLVFINFNIAIIANKVSSIGNYPLVFLEYQNWLLQQSKMIYSVIYFLMNINDIYALSKIIAPEEEESEYSSINDNPNKGSIFSPADVAFGQQKKEQAPAFSKIEVKLNNQGLQQEVEQPQPKAQQQVQKPQQCNKNDIWTVDEVQVQSQPVADLRLRPEVDVLYKQNVNAQDVYGGWSGMDPSSNKCQSLLLKIQLPETKSAEINLEVFKQQIILQTTKYYLNYILPYPINDKSRKAKWISDKYVLELDLQILREEFM